MDAPFLKMHGCGNDFVVLDSRARPLGITPSRAAAIAHRRTGIGCDQVIILETPPAHADVFMRIRNPDGSEAGACGNASRCVAALLAAESGRHRFTIRTISGDLPAETHPDGSVTIDMGQPRLDWQSIPLAREADTLHLDLSEGPVSDPAACSMGNPHASFFVPDLAALAAEQIGPLLEHAAMFPDRANIGFVHVLAPDHLRLRVWERGAGLTLGCGSGACAALVNAARRGLTGRRATVQLDGGTLVIAWRDDNHVLMTGPAVTVFRGSIDLAALPA